MPKPKPAPLNPFQRLVADNYGGGDYAHVQTLDECRTQGDTLFIFLMIELDAKEGTDTRDEALRRVTNARLQLQELERLIYRMPA